MSDENQQESAAPAAPQFDVDALAGQVADRLKDAFQQQRPAPAPAPAPPSAADPVGEMLNPYLNPIARHAALAAESATDAAEFYTAHTELDKAERLEIERRFKQLAATGNPFKREDILNHYRGENIDKEVDKRIAARTAAAERARDAATTVGPGSPDRGAPGVRDARSLSTDELAKALEGVSF